MVGVSGLTLDLWNFFIWGCGDIFNIFVTYSKEIHKKFAEDFFWEIYTEVSRKKFEGSPCETTVRIS